MSVEAWLYVEPAAWAALAGNQAIDQYTYENAITGFWRPLGGREVYHLPPTTQAVIDAFRDVLGDACGKDFRWERNPRLEVDEDGEPLPTPVRQIPADVVTVMPDRVTRRDSEGRPTETKRPTSGEPNWAHTFCGLRVRGEIEDFTNRRQRAAITRG